MKQIYFFLIVLFFLFFPMITGLTYADSSYVLPYPSDMPGSRLYKAQLLIERISQFWYFGNFGKFKYSLKASDKYLVEAKTLFEYDQFLLGRESLKKSNGYFSKLSFYLKKAKKEEKDISLSKSILGSASQKHIDVLEKLKKEVPGTVTWTSEKDKPTIINLHQEINKAISIRNESL